MDEAYLLDKQATKCVKLGMNSELGTGDKKM